MTRYGSFPSVKSVCPHCGDRTDREVRQYEMTGDSVAIKFCKHCEAAFFQLSDEEKKIVTYETDTNGVVTDIELPYTISRDVQTGSKVLKPVDDFDPSEFDTSEQQAIGDAYQVTTETVCAVCEGQAAGDCQILGKVVCHSCFSDARQNPETLRAYRDKLEAMYGEDELRDEFQSSWEDDAGEETIAEKLAEERESDSERPDDFRKWSVEQWKDAYVDGEINLVALEIGVGHALEEEMDLSGPDGDKFERSIEIAEELSGGRLKEEV